MATERLIREASDALVLTRPRRRRLLLLLLAPTAVALAIIAAVLLLTRPSTGPSAGPAPLTISADSVIRIDPVTHEVMSAAPVGRDPIAISAGPQGAFSASLEDSTITRLDPAGRVSRTYEADGKPTDLALGRDALWIANGFDGEIVKFPVGKATAGGRVRIPGAWYRDAAATVTVVGDSAVWAATTDGNLLFRISPASVLVVERITLPARPVDLATTPGAVWVANRSVWDSSVSRVDTASGQIATTPLPFAPDAVEAGDGAVWATGEGMLAHIDPASGSIVETARIARETDSVAVGVDPTTLEVRATIKIDARPGDVAVGGGSVWVTALPR